MFWDFRKRSRIAERLPTLKNPLCGQRLPEVCGAIMKIAQENVRAAGKDRSISPEDFYVGDENLEVGQTNVCDGQANTEVGLANTDVGWENIGTRARGRVIRYVR